jgi:hypothetical protein
VPFGLFRRASRNTGKRNDYERFPDKGAPLKIADVSRRNDPKTYEHHEHCGNDGSNSKPVSRPLLSIGMLW